MRIVSDGSPLSQESHMYLRRSRLLLVALLLQGAYPSAAAIAQRSARVTRTSTVNATTDPLLRSFAWRSIGPVSQGGRVDDIAVVESDPRTFYIGYATGGVWKTVNAGTTFEPIFETYGTGSIGAVAVSQANPNVVWVGTGEGNGRNNSSFGNGIYKSIDGGRTFTNVGLRESQTIQKVVIDPANPDVVYAAV